MLGKSNTKEKGGATADYVANGPAIWQVTSSVPRLPRALREALLVQSLVNTHDHHLTHANS